MRTHTACTAVLLVLCSCGESTPAASADCLVALNVKPGTLPAIEGVRTFVGDEPPKDLPGCERVLAVGFRSGAVAAQDWACSSRVPDALVLVDLPKLELNCKQSRPIPVLRYQRYPSHGQKEEMLVDGIEPWLARNGADKKFDKIEDGELLCRRWPGDARTTSCLLPVSKDWPAKAKAEHALADPAGAWQWALGEWQR